MVFPPSQDQDPFQLRSEWHQAQLILERLAALSYRAETLDNYLYEISCGVSHLLNLDWSVVTFCWEDHEKIMASSLNLGLAGQVISLHGTLTQTVIKTGKSLCVDNVFNHPEYGQPPEGYQSYLGVPLRTANGEVIGTVCSFCTRPREYTNEEVRVVELFAERAATAIDNYTLYQKQQQFNQILETEVIKRTEELQDAQAQLIEQERLATIGQFASMIVHEIRNPVTTILMGLNAFKHLNLSERDQIRLSLALEETDRLQNLLKEILLYAKPQVLEIKEIDMNHFLQETVLSLEEMPEISGYQIQLIPLCAPTQVLADKNKLKQVLINLIRNACEAISLGETVTCTAEQELDSQSICIRVHNGGEPIPLEILTKITQPFCSGRPGGTGLGLAIVKRIIDAHNGTLTIQSDLSTGTIVSFTIPISPENPSPASP